MRTAEEANFSLPACLRDRNGVSQVHDVDSDKCFPTVHHGSPSYIEDRLGPARAPVGRAVYGEPPRRQRRTYRLTALPTPPGENAMSRGHTRKSDRAFSLFGSKMGQITIRRSGTSIDVAARGARHSVGRKISHTLIMAYRLSEKMDSQIGKLPLSTFFKQTIG